MNYDPIIGLESAWNIFKNTLAIQTRFYLPYCSFSLPLHNLFVFSCLNINPRYFFKWSEGEKSIWTVFFFSSNPSQKSVNGKYVDLHWIGFLHQTEPKYFDCGGEVWQLLTDTVCVSLTALRNFGNSTWQYWQQFPYLQG